MYATKASLSLSHLAALWQIHEILWGISLLFFLLCVPNFKPYQHFNMIIWKSSFFLPKIYFLLQIIFVLNFLGGLSLVCIILPIDNLVMSFMRYIRFQFYVIRDDLVGKIALYFIFFQKKKYVFHSITVLIQIFFMNKLNLRENVKKELTQTHKELPGKMKIIYYYFHNFFLH